ADLIGERRVALGAPAGIRPAKLRPVAGRDRNGRHAQDEHYKICNSRILSHRGSWMVQRSLDVQAMKFFEVECFRSQALGGTLVTPFWFLVWTKVHTTKIYRLSASEPECVVTLPSFVWSP